MLSECMGGFRFLGERAISLAAIAWLGFLSEVPGLTFPSSQISFQFEECNPHQMGWSDEVVPIKELLADDSTNSRPLTVLIRPLLVVSFSVKLHCDEGAEMFPDVSDIMWHHYL